MSHGQPQLAFQTTEEVLGEQARVAAFRLARMQVFNWGTFSGVHEVAVAPDGFLFVGASGSGKSTFLDAHAALFIPPRWVDFNAAGRNEKSQGRDRSLVSYVRGMYGTVADASSSEVKPQYLRKDTTWSAIAATYRSGSGRTVTLVRLCWLRGASSASADLRSVFLVLERDADLREFRVFAEGGFEVRKLKQALPDVFISEQFSNYQDRFMSLLGIPGELALRLLQKTQGAKSLENINVLLRDYMLDVPKTFEQAKTLVNEFTELNEAHKSVVTAREQIDLLAPAHEQTIALRRHQRARSELDEVRVGLVSYQLSRELALLEESVASARIALGGCQMALEVSEESERQERARLREMQDRHRNAGGGQIETWEAEIQSQSVLRSERMAKAESVRQACAALSWLMPAEPLAFAEMVDRARDQLQRYDQWQEAREQRRDSLRDEVRDAERRFAEVRREVEAMQLQRSNVPAHYLDLRNRIAEALNLEPAELPYVAELIEVRESEAEWQGAIERVLGGFSLTVLVQQHHFERVRSYVNRHHLGGRLRYQRIDRAAAERETRKFDTDSLALKLKLAPGPFSEWLAKHLRYQFDYACVDSPEAMEGCPRSVTREGQVNRGGERYEKDDRFRIDDRSRWVLGQNNAAKLALYQAEAHKLVTAMEEGKRALAALVEELRTGQRGVLHCNTLVNCTWHEIDVAAVVTRIAGLEADIKAARDENKDLAELADQIQAQDKKVGKLATQLSNQRAELALTQQQIDTATAAIERKQNDPLRIPLTPLQQQRLPEWFDRHGPVVLENLHTIGMRVSAELGRESSRLQGLEAELKQSIEMAFAEFLRRWPGDAAGLDAKVESADDFSAKLKRLQDDGLPAHEQRFLALLQQQSGQNLTLLSRYIRDQHQEIEARIDMVNEAMRGAHFNVGTVLAIESEDKKLPEVRQFQQDVREVLSNSLAESTDPQDAERRFTALANIVRRLASKTPEDERWQQLVLDVRQHVNFRAVESDLLGNVIETYDSGAGKSGGQREKLAVTCLAAALRYQLAGEAGDSMSYTTVLIDEAFGRSDPEYTAAIVQAFRNFGFQPVMATPMRSVMVLEPFIGGACYVRIEGRNTSHASTLTVEETKAIARSMPPEEEPVEA